MLQHTACIVIQGVELAITSSKYSSPIIDQRLGMNTLAATLFVIPLNAELPDRKQRDACDRKLPGVPWP